MSLSSDVALNRDHSAKLASVASNCRSIYLEELCKIMETAQRGGKNTFILSPEMWCDCHTTGGKLCMTGWCLLCCLCCSSGGGM